MTYLPELAVLPFDFMMARKYELSRDGNDLRLTFSSSDITLSRLATAFEVSVTLLPPLFKTFAYFVNCDLSRVLPFTSDFHELNLEPLFWALLNLMYVSAYVLLF